MASNPTLALKSALAEHLDWHGARLGFLAQFLLALLKVRTVNLAELAKGFSGPSKVDSHDKRLQRFFRSFEIDAPSLARLLVRLVPVGEGPWRLTLDRTNWQFGQAELNLLVLGIAHRGIAVLLADREFVGEDWFRWLQKQGIPFHQRLKGNTLIPKAWNRRRRADALFGSLTPGQSFHLPGRRPVWGGFVHLSALRLADSEWLIIASFNAPQAQAIDAYADRWQIETLFGCLKSRGFNLEDTHLVDPERLGRLFALLALAFAWTYRTGELLNEQQPIRSKKLFSDLSSPSFATDSTSSRTSSLIWPKNSRRSCGL
jgi:hypothetical protein